jgi:hypothetical protein
MIQALRLSVVIASALVASVAAAQQDACREVLPPSLREALESANPVHRVPGESDSSSSCVPDRQRSGGNMCLLVAGGDFTGSGESTFAVLMPSRSGKDAPKLVVAVRTGGEWRLTTLSVGQSPRVSNLVLSTLAPGEYRETPAVLPDGVTGRIVKSRHAGFMVAGCDTWASGYFLLGKTWFTLALSD